MKRNLLLTLMLFLSACGTRLELANAESKALKQADSSVVISSYYDPDSLGKLLLVAGHVGNEYLRLSDSISTQQDAAALATLLTSAVGAAAVINEKSTSRIARIGLIGLTTSQGASYLRPAENAAALLRATERQMCLIGAGRRYDKNDESRTDAGFGVLADAFTRSRLQLRQEMTRGDFPDYTQLAQDYADAVNKQLALDRNKFVGRIDSLEIGIAKCFLAT